MGNMFTEKMIAPCGLDCSLCSQTHKRENACSGCMGPDENKPEFCSQRCDIIRCAKRKEMAYRFCDACPDFPCAHIMERENRYMSQYPLKESPLANLRAIREKGMAAFLQAQEAAWTCKACGGILSVHDGICSQCGKRYSCAEQNSGQTNAP